MKYHVNLDSLRFETCLKSNVEILRELIVAGFEKYMICMEIPTPVFSFVTNDVCVFLWTFVLCR